MSGAKQFRILIEDILGSFIKFGQVLSVQPDLLPAGYSVHLLDHRARERQADARGRAGDRQAGRIEALTRERLATASIAQVHARVDGRKGRRQRAAPGRRSGVPVGHADDDGPPAGAA
jgi:predicted unusual protein kinase regulating ubiquinone biosynthesis (AarF/ABC1/UbiB family)